MAIKFSRKRLSLALLLCSTHQSHPFTIHSQFSHSSVSQQRQHASLYSRSQKHHDDHHNGGVLENVPKNNTNQKKTLTKRLRTFGEVVLERSDTLHSAGLHNGLTAGAKTNITLFLLALGYKWYRSIFINKVRTSFFVLFLLYYSYNSHGVTHLFLHSYCMCPKCDKITKMAIWERQPQWNTVITSKEDEVKAKLEALTCKNCGATIFIAKGRKWFQMPRGYECYCCGASGNDNFENTRDDLLEEIDDDYFDYEKPLDFVTAAERKKLMREAGGDEKKATEILTQRNKEAAEAEASGDGEAPKKKKKKGKKKKKKKAVVEGEGSDPGAGEGNADESSETIEPTAEKATDKKKPPSDDDLDILGMD